MCLQMDKNLSKQNPHMIRVLIKPSIVHKLKLVRLMGISKQLYSHSISICEDTLVYENTCTYTHVGHMHVT